MTALAATGALATPSPARAETLVARGRVFCDADLERQGVAGVLVTNGVDVVVTDANGNYQLPIRGDAVISIVKPTGYATPVEAGTNLARFFYVHQPRGSDVSLGLSAPGVAPTGPLPASIDFHLVRREEPSTFEAILFADPQPETDADVDFIRDGVITNLAGASPAFGITLGDIVGDNLSLYPRINALIGRIGAPWYCAIGNHDLNFESPDNARARETFRSVFGPTRYAFEYGGALFIVLDNVVYHGHDPAKEHGAGDYHDEFDAEQLRFVDNVLQRTPRDRLVVLCMHIPLKSRALNNGDEVAVADTAALLQIVRDRPCVSFAGHTHMAETRYILPDEHAPKSRAHRHQVLATVSGAWWSGPVDARGVAISDCCDGTPAAHYLLRISGHACEALIRPTIAARRGVMRSVLVDRSAAPGQSALLPPRLTMDQLARADLAVNVFDGSARTQVAFHVGAGERLPLTPAAGVDPFVATEFERHRAAIKSYVQAEATSHLWRAPLPANLGPGVHLLTIEAVSDRGEHHRDTLIVEVAAPAGVVAMRG